MKPILRYHVRTGDGCDFWFATDDRARRFAEKTGGAMLGRKAVPADQLPPVLARLVREAAQ